MRFDQLIEFMMENSSANIKYRILKEILNEPIDTDRMQKLQSEVLKLPKVRKAFSVQREDGFIGSVIHGGYFDGFDSTVSLLKRYGVEVSNPHMQKAKESLINWTDYERDHFYKAGNAMDEHGRGGFRAILAEQLVELEADESLPQIQEQISNALAAFRGALNYTSVNDFSKKATMRGIPCRYYIKGATFPAANHISILEKTLSWRTDENLEMVKKSYKHCKDLMKNYSEGTIYVNCGYFVGPFNHNWNNKPRHIELHDFDSSPIDFAWFMKGLSNASKTYPIFNDGNPFLCESLMAWIDDGSFVDKVSDEQLRLYKKYASLQASWRKKESIASDLYFPVLLALNRCSRLHI